MNRPSIFSKLKYIVTYLFVTHLQRVGVHGTSAQVEPLNDGVEIYHRGWGTEIHGAGGQFVWMHFSIPVPSLVDNTQPAVSSIFFYFLTEGNAALKQVDVYDGKVRFHTMQTHRDGDFSKNLVLNVNKIEVIRSINTALGISLGFQLTQGESSVVVTAAGAEYIK